MLVRGSGGIFLRTPKTGLANFPSSHREIQFRLHSGTNLFGGSAELGPGGFKLERLALKLKSYLC